MKKIFRTYRRAITIFVLALLADLFFRFYFNFQMDKVFIVEALLFPLSGFILLLLKKRDGKENIKAARFDFWFAIFFILGGIRPMLKLMGAALFAANVIVLMLGVIIFIIFFLKLNKRNKSIS